MRKALDHAVAYFNTDVGVAGPEFQRVRRSLS